ncbi:MAG: fumarylacetoacetate hydrolase family protein [Bacteroidetes bacterium]|nr:fumarylacetoacetate hydrolase family protein [Bacteroidota bacterium]
MKLVSFLQNDEDVLAIYHNDRIFPVASLGDGLPDNMQDLLWDGKETWDKLHEFNSAIVEGTSEVEGLSLDSVELLAPVPHPTSCRDAYAFRQHVAAARKNRGVEMIPEFDQFPIFYFTNHNAITGPGEIEFMSDHYEKLDFELEVAIVVGKQGKDIPASEADEFIAGFMIMNDWSARVLQMEEMKLNLGPAKGKDFATTIGPWLVTPDELEQYKSPAKEGHTGINYDLKMNCWVNSKLVSEGSMADMDWTFAEILERASYGTNIFPGDVIGSGTVGTGCFLELNGTGLRLDPDNYQPQWVEENDVVEMEIQGLGRLNNKVLKADSAHSILALKKNAEVNS